MAQRSCERASAHAPGAGVNVVETLLARAEPIPFSGCLIWTGATDPKGYGRVNARTYGDSLAHRVVFAAAHGGIASDVHVLHRCDTPACVNPAHLFAGTNADNMQDCSRKGRMHPGERTASARLTADAVRAIRAARGESQASLAKRYGVGQNCIHKVLTRKTWRHV